MDIQKPYITDLCRKFRKKPTKTEKIFWDFLRNKKFQNIKFRRQHPIGRYVVDFFCYNLKLIIEIDGSIHNKNDQKEYDVLRQQELESEGYSFFRIKTTDNLESKFKELEKIILEQNPLLVGEGLPTNSREG